MDIPVVNPNSPVLQGKPEVDEFELKGAGKLVGKTVEMHVSAELMTNQSVNAPISPTGEIRVVQNAAGVPVIFSLASGTLDVLTHDPAAAGGWSAANVVDERGKGSEVTAFDVVQGNDGKIAVAIALAHTTGGATGIYTAWGIDESLKDWAGLAGRMIRSGGIDTAFRADAVVLDASDIGSPLCTVSGAQDGAEVRYYVPGANADAIRFVYPENVDANNLIRITAGAAFGQRAFFYLYKEGESQSLIATTLPDSGQGSETYSWSPGKNPVPGSRSYQTMASPIVVSGDPTRTSSDLFTASNDGLRVFPGGLREKEQLVTGALKDVREISVHHDGDDVSVWALVPPNLVYYIRGTRSADGYSFKAPVLFARDVTRLGAIRNRKRKANELFAVTGSDTIEHWWQDPATTNWQSTTIRTKDEGSVVSQPTYTTLVHVSADGGPPIDAKLQLTASAWTYATVNGQVLMLDRENPASIPVDGSGQVSIVFPATDLSVPILHVQSDVFEGTVNVWPDGKVQKGLAGVKDASSLRDARTQSGGNVFHTSLTNDVLDVVSQKISAISSAGGQSVPLAKGKVFATYDPDGGKATDTLITAGMPEFGGFALEHRAGKLQPADAGAIVAELSFDDIVHDVGDFFQDIGNAFAAGIKAIENETVVLADNVAFGLTQVLKDGKKVLHFFLKIAEKTFIVVLDTLSTAMKALTWILDKIGGVLMKILEWLGFTFLWDEIWKTHRLVADLVNNSMDWAVDAAKSGLDDVSNVVTKCLDQIEERLDGVKLDDKMKSTTLSDLAGNIPSIPVHSPQLSYATNHFLHSFGIEGKDSTTGPTNPLIQLANDVVLPVVKETAEMAKIDVEDLKDLSPGNLTLEAIFGLLRKYLAAGLQPVKALVQGVLKLAGDLIGDLRDIMQGDFGVPFLGGLYKFVTNLLTGGKGEKLTVVNGIALLLAIPATTMMTVLTGRSPAHNAPVGGFNRANVDMLLGSVNVSQPTQRSMAEAAEAPGPLKHIQRYYVGVGSLIAGFAGLAYTGISSVQGMKTLIGLSKGESASSEEVPENKGRNIKAIVAGGTLGLVMLGIDLFRFALTIPVPDGFETENWILYYFQVGDFLVAGLCTFISDVISIVLGITGPESGTTIGSVTQAIIATVVGSTSLLVDSVTLIVEGPDFGHLASLFINLASNLGSLGQGLGTAIAAFFSLTGVALAVAFAVAVIGIGARLTAAAATVVFGIVDLVSDDGDVLSTIVRPGG